MELKLNEICVRFSGKANIPIKLPEGDITLKVVGSIVAETETDNFDGSKDITQKVKLISVEVL